MTLVTTSMGGEAYAHWIAHALARARTAGSKILALFSSSVEEPVELLQQIVIEGFSPPITDRYQSVFVSGNPFVRDAIAARNAVSGDMVLATTGATSALSLICRTFLKPGDRVLVERPGFDLFGDLVRAFGGGVDSFRRQGDRFTIDPDEIAASITPRTRMIILSNLHNPSGMLIEGAVLDAIIKLAERHDLLVVVDEVYLPYTPAAARRPAVHLSKQVISVGSLTKMYGLSSLRCGWILAAPDMLAPIRQVNDRYEFGVSKLAHAVAALVFENEVRFDSYAFGVLGAARPIIERHFQSWKAEGLVEGVLPSDGCISFPKVVGVDNTLGLAEMIADRHGVIVAPGEFFGAAGHIRIGHAHAPQALELGLQRLGEGMRDFRGRQRGARTPTRQVNPVHTKARSSQTIS